MLMFYKHERERMVIMRKLSGNYDSGDIVEEIKRRQAEQRIHNQ